MITYTTLYLRTVERCFLFDESLVKYAEEVDTAYDAESLALQD
jgi:hypothetical protein